MTSIGNLACLVCSHLANESRAVRFLCHLPNGWSAACSEKCLNGASASDLSMIHLSHVFSGQDAAQEMSSLPIGFSMERVDDHWETRYYPFEHNPKEGEFLAPPIGCQAGNILGDREVFAYFLPVSIIKFSFRKRIVWIKLDEGTICIPFWLQRDGADLFQRHLGGGEVLEAIGYDDLCILSKDEGIKFLAVDFLIKPYDVALLA